MFPYPHRRWNPSSPSLVMSAGPDRTVRDQPAEPGDVAAHPIGFTPPPSTTTRCGHALCPGRHCAGGEHRPTDTRDLVRAAASLTTEARLHTR